MAKDENRPQEESGALQEQADRDVEKSESVGPRPGAEPAPGDAPVGSAQRPGGPRPPTYGEPLASANARQGITADRLNDRDGGTLVSAEARPLPVSGRLRSNEKEGYHYHWFGDDVMRTEYGLSLGYEFVDRDGEPADYDKAAKIGGLVRMRTKTEDYLARRDRLNRVITPQAERAGREQFVATGESLDEDTQPFDATRSRRGPFSQVARKQADGSLREEG